MFPGPYSGIRTSYFKFSAGNSIPCQVWSVPAFHGQQECFAVPQYGVFQIQHKKQYFMTSTESSGFSTGNNVPWTSKSVSQIQYSVPVSAQQILFQDQYGVFRLHCKLQYSRTSLQSSSFSTRNSIPRLVWIVPDSLQEIRSTKTSVQVMECSRFSTYRYQYARTSMKCSRFITGIQYLRTSLACSSSGASIQETEWSITGSIQRIAFQNQYERFRLLFQDHMVCSRFSTGNSIPDKYEVSKLNSGTSIQVLVFQSQCRKQYSATSVKCSRLKGQQREIFLSKVISPKVPNCSPDSGSKEVANIDSNSPRNLTSKILPRYGHCR